MSFNRHIQDYIDVVKSGKYPVCEEQVQLIELVERVLAEDGVYVDEAQLEKYMGYQKYFPFDLFPWERFLFALHNCLYTSDGFPRFPVLFGYMGRGSGKNGLLGFENFSLLTPENGVEKYHIYDYANSEEQAKRSWEDVRDVLEDPKHTVKLKKHFSWNSEVITNLQTKSEYRYMPNNAKTGDSYRPGKVNHDEIHAMEDTSAITTAITGLGKRPLPKRTILTTDGDVRGGYLDELLQRSRDILNGEIEDGGFLPFICHLESDEEIENPDMWYKANPSLQYLPTLMWEMKQELIEYQLNPITNHAFPTKRMNRPPAAKENAVASWELICKTNQPIDMSRLKNKPCVAACDYAKTNDFVSAGLLYYIDNKYIWITHTWVCRQSADLPRIKPPLQAWEKAGFLTFVNSIEISPELPAVWIAQTAASNNSPILKFGIDFYRYSWLRRALESVNINGDKKGKVFLVRPSNEMQISPVVTSAFTNELIVWGDNPLMRWAANNTKMVMSDKGNITYGKIEPKSRKTDPFKAFISAMCVVSELEKYEKQQTALSSGLSGLRFNVW